MIVKLLSRFNGLVLAIKLMDAYLTLDKIALQSILSDPSLCVSQDTYHRRSIILIGQPVRNTAPDNYGPAENIFRYESLQPYSN